MIYICAIIAIILALFLWYGVPLLYRWSVCVRHQKTCSKGILCLTYDDGPDMAITPHILRLLEEYSVRATFFVLGSRLSGQSDLAEEIARSNHELASHSQCHFDAWRSFPFMAFADIKRGYSTLKKIAGSTTVIRPPYGRLDLPSLIWLKLNRIRPVWWTHDSADCRIGEKTPEQLLEQVSRNGGGIVLLHDFLPDNDEHGTRHAYVLDCTRALIEHGQSQGWKILIASEIDTLSSKTK